MNEEKEVFRLGGNTFLCRKKGETIAECRISDNQKDIIHMFIRSNGIKGITYEVL